MIQGEHPEETLFEAALKLPADQRPAFLDQTCAGDANLRRRVEVLLAAFERAGGFMKQPATPERTTRLSLPPTEKPGDRIGRYKLLEQIGEGGCGVVYVAEQEQPVRRRVALKVIKLGMDTKQVIARFDAERQAVAMMDHPNIAKVFDAGATETGRPYFVMELVRGIKITEYCHQTRLPPRERLDLFIQVCRAIQHAHQKGIIHRDIKPSNILVTLHDGVPVPKVIDFGIAKATQGRLTDQTVYTAFEQFIGTPAYMSPEQAEMSGLDIDTRSDIYSLGVLLYELLTATTPFDAKELLAKGLDEMRRTIREVEPPKPSTRLTQELVAADVRRLHSKLEPRDPQTEEKIRASSRRLLQEVRGDLDCIVMKALEKDRNRRYETAGGLASDVQRHLKNEPIAARPPSRLYQWRKSIQRNKLTFAAATAVLAALLVGLCVATWQADRATRAEQEQRRLRETAQKETEFLKSMLKSALPGMVNDPNLQTHLGILDELQNAPETEAELRSAMADAYTELGLYNSASAMRNRATSLRQNLYSRSLTASATLRGPAIAVICWGAALVSAGLAALAVQTLRRRLRLLTFVCVPASFWILVLALAVAVVPGTIAVRLLGSALFGTVIGASSMIWLPRRRVLPTAGADRFPVSPWIDASLGLAFFIALVGAFYTIENGRGKLAWEKCKHEYQAKGHTLDWDHFIPQAVPDEQNIFKAPKITEWFVSRQSVANSKNDLIERLSKGRPLLPLAELRVLPLSSTNRSDESDLKLRYDSTDNSLFDLATGDSVVVTENAKTIFDLQGSAAMADRLRHRFDPGESFETARGGTVFKREPARIRILFYSDTVPTGKQIASLLGPFMPMQLTANPTGSNSFQLVLAAETAADFLKWSDQFAPQLHLMREALKRPYARIDGDYSVPFEAPSPNFVTIRMVAQFLQECAISHLLLDQPQEALADLTLMHDLRHLLDRLPSARPELLVEAMINSAVGDLYAATIAHGMRLRVWQEPQLVELQRQLGETKLVPLVAKAFACEPAATCHWAETVPSRKFINHGATNLSRLQEIAAVLWPRGWTYQNMANVARLEFKALDAFDSAYGIVLPRIEEAAHSNAVQFIEGKSPFNLLAAEATPNFRKASMNAARNQNHLNQTQIVCALERYRLARGEYPETLDALAPQFINKIPHDVIGGQPLHYRRTAEQKFLLYSVGWNETDDGGVSRKDTDAGDWVWK